MFQDRKVLNELGHFNMHFVNNTRRKRPTGKHSGVFSPRCS